ncbi:DUF6602 domain-containing protein [Rhizobium tibeticum]
MYEGLTKDLLNKAIPDGLDLKIVSGFVIDGKGGSSGQLDCMLVRGEGSPVPFVDGLFQWHVRDVLAVFEVKKTSSHRIYQTRIISSSASLRHSALGSKHPASRGASIWARHRASAAR